jgi:hypothetical protein
VSIPTRQKRESIGGVTFEISFRFKETRRELCGVRNFSSVPGIIYSPPERVKMRERVKMQENAQVLPP